MKVYAVPPGTDVVVVAEDVEWAGLNFRVTKTKRINQFNEDELVLDPVSCVCKHHAPNAQTFGPAYARNGYYGFKRDGFIMLVLKEYVTAGKANLAA